MNKKQKALFITSIVFALIAAILVFTSFAFNISSLFKDESSSLGEGIGKIFALIFLILYILLIGSIGGVVSFIFTLTNLLKGMKKKDKPMEPPFIIIGSIHGVLFLLALTRIILLIMNVY